MSEPESPLVFVLRLWRAVEEGQEVDFDAARARLVHEQDQAAALGEELGGRRRRRRKQAEAANYIADVTRRLVAVVDALERGDFEAAELATKRALAGGS